MPRRSLNFYCYGRGVYSSLTTQFLGLDACGGSYIKSLIYRRKKFLRLSLLKTAISYPRPVPQNKSHRRLTSWFFLWFSNDFGVTVIRHQNADAMVLAIASMAIARLRGIHPPDTIQNGGRPGGMPQRALARTMESALWWRIMAWQRLLESTFCMPYSVLICGRRCNFPFRKRSLPSLLELHLGSPRDLATRAFASLHVFVKILI
jgi:hypothetical protein